MREVFSLNKYIIIAGIDGTGKTSFRGVLEGQGLELGHIIDPDLIAKTHNFNEIAAGKAALREIDNCLDKGMTFTQETTLSGHQVLHTIRQAKEKGYLITMYYIGLNSKYESIYRIANRVRKGGHDIPPDDVKRRFEKRFVYLSRVVPLCNKTVFYDNENGFVKVAEITDGVFTFSNSYRPDRITEYEKINRSR